MRIILEDKTARHDRKRDKCSARANIRRERRAKEMERRAFSFA